MGEDPGSMSQGFFHSRYQEFLHFVHLIQIIDPMKFTALTAACFVLFTLFSYNPVCAQEGAQYDQQELQNLWNSNIRAIIDLDVEKIIQQTNFPLQGDWYVAYELWDASEEELQEAYINDPGVVFDPDTRARLAEMSWEEIVVNDYEEGIVLSVPVYLSYEAEGEIYEFVTFYEFAKIEEQWMLIGIVYAG
jgi:hypothetical protein